MRQIPSKANAAAAQANGPFAGQPVCRWLMPVLLAAATIALYWPAMQHGFVNYDDDRYVTANPVVQRGLSFDNLKWAFLNPVADNWHPLTVLSHMLVCQFFGLNPLAHHLTSVLLHAANAVLVFLLLRRLSGATWRSVVVAALFAFHPLRVESVAWIAERKDVLSGLFGLLALIFYTGYARARGAGAPEKTFLRSSDYWLAVAFFALGLMGKPMLVTWPFVLLLLDYWPLQRLHISTFRGLVLEKVPFMILAAVASIVTFWVQQHGAAVETMQNLPFGARVGNALIAYCRYLEKTFWPSNLAVLYPHPGHWPLNQIFLAGGFLLAISVLVVAQRRRHPYLLVGWAWFVGTLIPVIGLVQVGLQSMADRYTYLPSLGVLMAIVWGAAELASKRKYRLAILASLGCLAISLCAGLTWRQQRYWHDGEMLFRHTLAVTENNYVAHYNLGVAFDDKNRTDEAIREYKDVLRLKPDFADAQVNLGLALDQKGDTEEAIGILREAIRLVPKNPNAHNNLGMALFHHGQTEDAIREYQEALRLKPDDVFALNNLGAALYTKGWAEEAIRQFQAALTLQSDYADARCNLAKILAKQGKTDEAIRQFQEVLRQNPGNAEARAHLTELMATQGKP